MTKRYHNGNIVTNSDELHTQEAIIRHMEYKGIRLSSEEHDRDHFTDFEDGTFFDNDMVAGWFDTFCQLSIEFENHIEDNDLDDMADADAIVEHFAADPRFLGCVTTELCQAFMDFDAFAIANWEATHAKQLAEMEA